jgi:hypothetical protein
MPTLQHSEKAKRKTKCVSYNLKVKQTAQEFKGKANSSRI